MGSYRIRPWGNGWALFEEDQAEPMAEAEALHEVMGVAERVIGDRRMSVQIRYRHGAPDEFCLQAKEREMPDTLSAC